MRHLFDEALSLVLVHEGGYVNHPADPGGATNKGITQATYNVWRTRNGQPKQNVRKITDAEVAAIYRRDYWGKVRGDDLPAGVDYAVFDFAVNSGPSRAARFLQRIVGVDDDGVIGPITLAAVQAMPPGGIIVDLCDARLAWLKQLSTWNTFGRGWSRRVNEVEVKAVRMADLSPAPVPPPPDVPEPEPKPGLPASWWVRLLQFFFPFMKG